MISHLAANELLDLYGSMLSKRQQEILKLYFQEDLSLSEIQDELGISRAAVYDALNKGIKSMEQYETQLQLLEKKKILRAFVASHPEYEEELSKLFG